MQTGNISASLAVSSDSFISPSSFAGCGNGWEEATVQAQLHLSIWPYYSGRTEAAASNPGWRKGEDESSAGCLLHSFPSFPCLTFLRWGEGGRSEGRWLAASPLTTAFSMSLQSIIWCGDRKGLISVRLKYRYGPGYKLQNVQARGEAINKAISSVITASLSANHLSKIFFWKRYSLPLRLDCEFNGSRTNNIPP